MKLYKIEASNMEAFFGTPEEPIERDVVGLAQTPSCDAFLFLAKNTFDEDEPELLDSVPTGFDFTYCQEWGLTIDDDVVDRVILDLRKKAYPSWQDQLDDNYHNGVDGWKETIKATKDKYPKIN
jgi:hypothetical protein